jgi:hypothetical protein
MAGPGVGAVAIPGGLPGMTEGDLALGFGIPLLLSQASCGKIFIRDFLPLRVKGLLP